MSTTGFPETLVAQRVAPVSDMTATPSSPLGLSVIIPNYNYQEFVAQAIDSALAIDAPRVQVIVVDDGSTDNSREVIETYRGRVTIVHQANAGQFEAYNAGFKLAREEVVIFLDSDDMLDASVFREIAAVWRSGLSKVQYRMRTVDAIGRPLGSIFPQFEGVPTPREILRWASTTAYPTPPGSGNAYARSALAQIFPLDDSCGRPGDASCVAAAPFLGDVVTIPLALASYRVHGRNDGAAASSLDVGQFQLHVVRTLQRHRYAQRIARRVGIEIDDRAIDGSLSYLPYRLSSLRLGPESHPIARDSRGAVLWDVWRALFKPQGMALKGKLSIGAWATLVALLPRKASRQLMLWRFVPATRPKLLRQTLLKLGVVR